VFRALFVLFLTWTFTFSTGLPALQANDASDPPNLAAKMDAEKFAADIKACSDEAAKLVKLSSWERDLARIEIKKKMADDRFAAARLDLIDAFAQLMLDEEILEKAAKAFQPAVPEIFVLNAQRNVEGDRNAVIRAINRLRTGDMPRKDLETMSRKAMETISKKTNDTRKN
jgi:hypothetical protein